MDIKKIYTENGKVIKEYFVHKEDAKEVASKLGIGDDLVETLENIFATDEFIVVEKDNGILLLNAPIYDSLVNIEDQKQHVFLKKII